MLTPKILFILSAITSFILTVSSQSTSPNHVGCTYSFEGLCNTEEDNQEIAALRQEVRHLNGICQLAEDRFKKQLLNLTKEVMLYSLNHTGNLEEQLQTMNATLYLTKEKLQLVEERFRNVTTELQQVKENAQQQLEYKQEKLQLLEDRFKNMTTELQQVKKNAQEDKQEKLQLGEERFKNLTTALEQVKENAQQQLEYKQGNLQLVEERFKNVTTELQQVKENAQQQLQNISLTANECSCQRELDLLNSNVTYLYKVMTPDKDCAELYERGVHVSGVYKISPSNNQGAFDVYCDMETDGGGWTVFQRRQDGSIDFYRNWNNYKTGFGNITGEFWLGNDNLHRLTAAKKNTLRVDLEDWSGVKRYAVYQEFAISNETDKYRITFGSYSGDAGDALSYHRGQQFTTRDQDNDGRSSVNCAILRSGAWWYNGCHHSNLNGVYYKQETRHSNGAVAWLWFSTYHEAYHYSNDHKSLKMTEMKIRPAGF